MAYLGFERVFRERGDGGRQVQSQASRFLGFAERKLRFPVFGGHWTTRIHVGVLNNCERVHSLLFMIHDGLLSKSNSIRNI